MSRTVFKEWTVIFPGKMGLSWKQGWGVGTQEEAEAEANKHCNTVAVPVQLFENLQQNEQAAMKWNYRSVEIEDNA